MRVHTALLALASRAPLVSTLALLSACSSTPALQLDIDSVPTGAKVSVQLRGVRSYVGQFAVFSGSVSSKRFEDEFFSVGTTPVQFSTPLKATTTDATLLGFGGKVVRRFEDALIRFELDGFEPVEKFVALKKGSTKLNVELVPAASGS